MPTRSAVPAANDRLCLNDGVFLVAEDGVARLLDFERGRFYALDPTGSALLVLGLRHGVEHAASRVALRCQAPVARVRADLATLRAGLARRGLLAGAGGERRLPRWLGALVRPLACRSSDAMPSRLEITSHLVLAWASLRLFGWLRTLELWRRHHRPPPASAPPTAVELAALDRRLRSVAAGLLLPMNCKERALAMHQILRARCGLPACLVVGIQRHPFAAHAWVECEGQVLTDDAARCATFKPIARYP
jgi:hypothetical protein